MGILVGLVGLVGFAVLIVMTFGHRAAREGRGDEDMRENLLVAPRGARFGDATAMVRQACAREHRAEVVQLHERRARRITGHAA